MLICVLGLSASGKDFVVKQIENKYKLNKVVQFTSRPIRDNEVEGDAYYFIEEKDFLDSINNNEFLTYRKFNATAGEWYYGIKKSSVKLNEAMIMCIDIEGLTNLRDEYGEDKIISIFIDSNYKTRIERAKKRPNFNEEEFERRNNDDLGKIEKIKEICNYIIENNENNNEYIGEISKIIEEEVFR